MTKNTSKYAGDKALLVNLNRAGSKLNLKEALAIIRGVISVSEPCQNEEWVELLVQNADDALREQLRLFKEKVGECYDPGFTTGPAPRERISRLRAELSIRNLDGFIVPHADEYQNEYVPDYAARLRWLTGFSGSAGLLIVLEKKAAIFVDGRYTLQVLDQVDKDFVEPISISNLTPVKWLVNNLLDGGKVGYDPWLLSESSVKNYRESIDDISGKLVSVTDNPVDKIWLDRPSEPISPVVPHEYCYSGKRSSDKRKYIANSFLEFGIDAAVLTQPDSIAWLLNIRGGDVAHTPLPLSFAILSKNGLVDLFIDTRKIIGVTPEHLGSAVVIHPQDEFTGALEALAKSGAVVQADPNRVASVIFEKLEGATIVRAMDPCSMPKACKNIIEVEGSRAAHKRDGRALTEFLAWFAKEAPKGNLTELEAADQLANYRFENELIRGLSFRTISGVGPNGAIVHYSVTEATSREITSGELFLLDSGAQYLDGTTDVTRTIAVGVPSRLMRDRFTRVLKGHIALATARFPLGTTGAQLDTLARAPLWSVGLDFDHGTGHGVGSYLGVHEGPQGISKRSTTVPLKPGMIISNEPGYYRSNEFGIRIENLVTVVYCDQLDGAENTTMEFETLTLAPIDLSLIDLSLLAPDEVAWLNAYHVRVRDAHIELVESETADWLARVTRPLVI